MMQKVFYAYEFDYDWHVSLIIASSLDLAKLACEAQYLKQLQDALDSYQDDPDALAIIAAYPKRPEWLVQEHGHVIMRQRYMQGYYIKEFEMDRLIA